MSETKKKESVKTVKDTYPKMPWKEFLKVIERCGFKIGYTNEFDSMSNPFVEYEDKEKREVILYHKGKKLILYAIFSNSEELKSLKLYGEGIPKDEKQQPLVIKGAHFKVRKWHQKFEQMDVTTGLVETLEVINLYYNTCKWTRVYLYLKPRFLTRDEERLNTNKRNEIINEKIDAADPAVSKIVYGL